jgi:hypothetical protein
MMSFVTFDALVAQPFVLVVLVFFERVSWRHSKWIEQGILAREMVLRSDGFKQVEHMLSSTIFPEEYSKHRKDLGNTPALNNCNTVLPVSAQRTQTRADMTRSGMTRSFILRDGKAVFGPPMVSAIRPKPANSVTQVKPCGTNNSAPIHKRQAAMIRQLSEHHKTNSSFVVKGTGREVYGPPMPGAEKS